MRVELVCIGTELLTGKVSTHSSGLSERLRTLGLALARETVVGDDPGEMAAVFREAWRRADLVLCSGGLGPTFDDITRDVWARVLRKPLRFQPPLLRDIRAKFRLRRLAMPPSNRRQAFVLAGAEALDNPRGTAPGQRLAFGRKSLALLPGPAEELFPMVDRHLLPWLAGILPPRARRTRVWRVFGAPESEVDARMRPLVSREKSAVWGILAHEGVVDMKATVSGPSDAEVSSRLDLLDRRVRAVFGREIFGTGRETLEEVVGGLLRRRGETLALAESCTGGGLGERLTRSPGSSAYFIEGRVTYADGAKARLLGVPGRLLRSEGAVSRACALAMARGVRKRSGADWGFSVTGVAGPDGGTARKPVGLVFMALAGGRGSTVWEHRFPGDRAQVRRRSVLWALEHLRRTLDMSLRGAK